MYSEKTCPSAILSTINPTWPDSGSNPGLCGGKAATNHSLMHKRRRKKKNILEIIT
jgi:hypothetical protein